MHLEVQFDFHPFGGVFFRIFYSSWKVAGFQNWLLPQLRLLVSILTRGLCFNSGTFCIVQAIHVFLLFVLKMKLMFQYSSWQMLSYDNSPSLCISTFTCSHYLISKILLTRFHHPFPRFVSMSSHDLHYHWQFLLP